MVGCTQTCPKCGGSGRILDGVYSALGDALHVLLQQPNPHMVNRLVSVLREGKERKKSPDQIRADIEKTAPELRTLADCLPHNRTELYVVIALIISSLALVIPHCGSKPTQQEVNQYIDNSINLIYRSGSGE